MKIASALTLSIAVVGAALLLPASPASSQSQVDNAIPADMATRFTGKAGTVCGKVGKARFAENAEGTPTFLYMGGNFPRHTFTARIPGDARAKFKPAPEELEGKDVCVIGTIERDSSRAEIVVNSPSNLKLATIR
ncbi:hypothetical protein MUU77_08235 [Pseudoxanthomonas sp. F37]|jgi:hypothetical protein|uniref:hypothetical protein n=1 Tax=Pseudoxanthomonas TaxID=83618 RepID=UPI001FD4C09D|nr:MULTISPECIES: hypothetical protein [Pseudoxanthomonas]UOV05246.1 hypothetical protein MUU75_00375 [Pseudoxanthomonas mexicana]UOV10245.1 hypothetical protein MUU77_08235 [Pseudoxanthomonas sp. F37]